MEGWNTPISRCPVPPSPMTGSLQAPALVAVILLKLTPNLAQLGVFHAGRELQEIPNNFPPGERLLFPLPWVANQQLISLISPSDRLPAIPTPLLCSRPSSISPHAIHGLIGEHKTL